MTPTEATGEWFTNWFDSPYYPLLYQHRDQTDATQLLDSLLPRMGLPPAAPVLDLACGDGRHSLQLARRGFQVTGVDLSPSSIQRARELASHLAQPPHFAVRDMRQLEYEGQFDAVFNLFTSFGYFDSEADNLRVLKGVAQALRPGGWVVIDYLNAEKVANALVPNETKSVNGVSFQITRFATRSHIIKEIEVLHNGQLLRFFERVQRINQPQFQQMLATSGFTLQWSLGDYDGNAFQPEHSPRLIVGARKPS